MRFAIHSSLLAATYWIISANALPRPFVTYSVVNVDGGSQSVPTPTVVYQTITKSDDTPETISVTMTAMVTDHTTQWTKATETALIPEVSPHHGIPKHRPQPEYQPTVTVVSVMTPSPTTTKYYDNGQWHTSYAVKNFSSASGYHPGQWKSSASSGYAPSASASWQASGSAAPSGWNSSASY